MDLLDCFIAKIWPLSSSDIAAWVQAIGSILAVIVALLIVLLQFWHQGRIAKNKQKELIKRYMSSFISLAGGIDQKANLLNQWALNQNGNNLNFMRAEVSIICKEMESLPIWQIETFDEIVTVVSLKTDAALLLETLIQAENQFSKGITWNQATLTTLSTIIPDIKQKLPLLIKLERKRL